MADKIKNLFLSAEVAPFAKTGGLGDVGGSLPKALHALGHDVRVVMPAYRNIEAGYPEVEPLDLLLQVSTGSGVLPAGVFQGSLPGSDVPVYFIGERTLFDRPNIYGYWDDAQRFSFYCLAALELARSLDWKPDIVHAHDWHTAPALTWLATSGLSDPFYYDVPSVFTIHNLAHQGRTGWGIMDYLQVQTHSLVEEPYGEVNFMARGIYHSTLLNTVSPTYASEILTPSGGAHLDGLLRHREYDVHGILNGLDYDVWDPATDERIAAVFDKSDLNGRLQDRRALQTAVGLPLLDDVPIVAMISRLDAQKGLDITGPVIHQLMSGTAGEAQFVVLGSGAAEYESLFANLAAYHNDKMSAILEYSAGLAPVIYAGSDMFIMPSLFEPCGLGQLIAMRYGSVPVVRATGGLADTVDDGITGYTFYNYSAGAFWDALARAIFVYRQDPDTWQAVQQAGMGSDFSWGQSAEGYQQLYEWAIARRRYS